MMPRILLLIEERELRDWLRHHLEILWPEAEVRDLPLPQFVTQIERWDAKHLDLVVLAVDFGSSLGEAGDGLDVLRIALDVQHCPPVLVIAGGGNELTAVRAMRIGAADYLPRSMINAQRIADAIKAALRVPRRAKLVARSVKPARPREVEPWRLDLPQYTLLHQLGESARATVYLAYSAVLGRNVALKVSKPEGDECQEFAREYAAISALRHPSVVDIYDYGFHDGREFIAMEYFPCGDLKTRLQQPMTTLEALEYAERICAALEAVHGAGLLHRDLKPPNVMLREDGSIVLIDFGLARQLDKAHLNTVAGVLRGSPYYMSPEQAQGLALDARSDLYSTGVILYEMLSGTKPYLGSTAVEVMQQHVTSERPPLPAACESLEPVMSRLMARDPEQRFASASEARAALTECIHRWKTPEAPLERAVNQQ